MASRSSELSFPFPDRILLQELRGQRPSLSIKKILREAFFQLGTRAERRSFLYYRRLLAPALLDTEDPFVDDDLFAAVIRHRATKPRWEAAWHLRGDIRVADDVPLVFTKNRCVPGSMGFSEDVGLKASMWRTYVGPLIGRPTIRADCVILLRDFWDNNYWHLLHDLLPRLAMAEALDLDPTIPVVVSEAMIKVHVERLSGTPFLKGRTVIVQPPGHTLCCKELFLLRPGEFASHWARKVATRIPSESSATVGSRYIYCRREPEHSEGRTAENYLEIEEIFRSAGFTAISPASMTLGQQKATFEQAEIVAGINGAAFANTLFRCGRSLTIGALISANRMSTIIPTMAKVFGFRYTGFVVHATTEGENSSILVPRDTASRLIEWLLNPDTTLARAIRGKKML